MNKAYYFCKNYRNLFICCLTAFLFICNYMPVGAVDLVYDAYKHQLSSDQIAVYNQIYDKAYSYETDGFKLVTPLTETELEDVMNCFFSDQSEIFWLNTAYKYGVNSNNKVIQLQLKYGISKESLDNAKLSYEEQINTIVDKANQYKNDLDKEKCIHDCICAMNTYNRDANLSQSAYSALGSGSTACAGYAKAFQIICQRTGIPCYYITGESRGRSHAWNIVFVDGKYYNVDLTWDDSISERLGYDSYDYFNKSDSEFEIDHTRSVLSAGIVYCN
ncbi:MAG: hypothetical protein K5883_00010 [Pseudobutyrivibrio sp.]|nr:hypothetical protein [Pseudobutyrivibrio sp.]